MKAAIEKRPINRISQFARQRHAKEMSQSGQLSLTVPVYAVSQSAIPNVLKLVVSLTDFDRKYFNFEAATLDFFLVILDFSLALLDLGFDRFLLVLDCVHPPIYTVPNKFMPKGRGGADILVTFTCSRNHFRFINLWIHTGSNGANHDWK